MLAIIHANKLAKVIDLKGVGHFANLDDTGKLKKNHVESKSVLRCNFLYLLKIRL